MTIKDHNSILSLKIPLFLSSPRAGERERRPLEQDGIHAMIHSFNEQDKGLIPLGRVAPTLRNHQVF